MDDRFRLGMHVADWAEFAGQCLGALPSWTGCVSPSLFSFLHLTDLTCISEWRRPPHPQRTPSYATYVQIVTWFLDAPSPEAPFSVHRMALAGKELGKDVGQWFGPSTAAGAIKTLVHAFPESGLGVALSEDGSLYESDVYAASWSGRRRQDGREWGDRPVLVLLGIRLGLDGVNPIYYDTIKVRLLLFSETLANISSPSYCTHFHKVLGSQVAGHPRRTTLSDHRLTTSFISTHITRGQPFLYVYRLTTTASLHYPSMILVMKRFLRMRVWG